MIAAQNGAGPGLHGRGHDPTAARSLLRLRDRARLGSGNGRECFHHRPGDAASHIGAAGLASRSSKCWIMGAMASLGGSWSRRAPASRRSQWPGGSAEQARVRGLVPIAVDVYLRLRRVLEEELRHRTLMLILPPGSPLEPAREALLAAAATVTTPSCARVVSQPSCR